MADFWVVVADEGNARLFATDKIRTELNEFETLTNPDARLQERELVAGGMGRSFDSHGDNRHAMEPQTSAREQAAIRFARTIADKLEHGAESHAYERLILVAPPDMLGLLRGELDQNALKRIHHTVGKDLVHANPGDILKHLSA